MQTKSIIIGVLLLIIVALTINLVVRERRAERAVAASFDECVRQGNQILESSPRQCKDASGTIHTEASLVAKPVTDFRDPRLTVSTAQDIAFDSSVCTREGRIGDFVKFETETGTWRFMIDGSVREYCSPVCVVFDDTGGTEVDLNCDDSGAQ